MSEKPSFNYSFSIDGFGPHYDSNRISGHQFMNPSMNIARQKAQQPFRVGVSYIKVVYPKVVF